MTQKEFIQTKINSVAIIDTRPIFRKGLKLFLEHIGESLKVIDVGKSHELAGRPLIPDVFFLGVGDLSDIEIIDNLSYLKTLNNAGKIVMYDYRNSLDYILLFFPNKVDAYLPESFDNNDLVECMKSLSNSRLYLNSEILLSFLSTGTNQFYGQKKQPYSMPFSEIENTIAGYLLTGMSTSQIAKQMQKSMSRISSVKANIYKKAKVSNIVELSRILENK